MSTFKVLQGTVLATILATVGCGDGDRAQGGHGSAQQSSDQDAGKPGLGVGRLSVDFGTGGSSASGGAGGIGWGRFPHDGFSGAGASPGSGGSSDSGGAAGMGATGGTDSDAAAGDGGDSGAGASAGSDGDSGVAGAAGCDPGAGTRSLMNLNGQCIVTACANHVYQCGDCLDNDGDGLSDMDDPDCLGPCHNDETRFFLSIPGANNAPCKQDCYFDQDTGSGNDGCYWSQECDIKEIPPFYDPAGPACAWDPEVSTPGTEASCAELSITQPKECDATCSPLTPNGCDCFGCCEIPGGGGNYVWLGSTVDGVPSCDLAHANDPSRCRPCTPVQACLNPCDECELCIGKTELPASCLCDAPGANQDTCGVQECDADDIPCGMDCQAPCAEGFFCLTGCCQPAPQ